jgi:hypothetical protein
VRPFLLAILIAAWSVAGCAFLRGLGGGAESAVTGDPPPPPPPGDNRTLYEIGAILGAIGTGYAIRHYLPTRKGGSNGSDPAAADPS